MANGNTIPLTEIARRLPMLEVACSRCPRRGRYRTAKLVARFGDIFKKDARKCLGTHQDAPDVYKRLRAVAGPPFKSSASDDNA